MLAVLALTLGPARWCVTRQGFGYGGSENEPRHFDEHRTMKNARDKLERMYRASDAPEMRIAGSDTQEGADKPVAIHAQTRMDIERAAEALGRGREVEPDARDYKAAEHLLRGTMSPQDALRKAGFPESRARMGMYAVSRSKSLRIALMSRMCRLSEIPLPDVEQRKALIRAQLLVNMLTNSGARGGNMAARLLGLDKELNMWQSDIQSGVLTLLAPGAQVNVNAPQQQTILNQRNVVDAEPPADSD